MFRAPTCEATRSRSSHLAGLSQPAGAPLPRRSPCEGGEAVSGTIPFQGAARCEGDGGHPREACRIIRSLIAVRDAVREVLRARRMMNVRINSRASSCSFSLVWIGVSIDRLREDIWKFAHLIFTVTVRPRQFVFSHQAQTSSAIAITPASIRTGSIRSSGKVVSDPEDFRSRSG